MAFSNGSPTQVGDQHGIATIHVQNDGAISVAFDSVMLHSRPIHITVAPDAHHLLVAYNKPSAVTVHPLTPHGRPGDAIVQRETIDTGVYAHQVRVTPDGSSVLLVTRGNDSKPGQAEDPGAIRQFTFDAGQLSAEHVVAPNGGYGFGPRHVDFHPHRPWVYVSIERQNQLMMFEMRKGRLADAPSFTIATVRDPSHIRPRQMPAAIHVSRDGRYVYVSNRADHTVRADGTEVFDGGENSIALFSIDPMTGRPQLMQSADTESFNPRTFSLTSDGKRLTSGSIEPMIVRTGSSTETVPATLTLFDVEKTGRLMFRNKTAVETNGDWMFWSGTMSITA